jgi:hypothetical protein
MNLLSLKLFKFVASFFNVSKFIKRYDINKIDEAFCLSILKNYVHLDTSALYIYANNFKYDFGLTSESAINDSRWSNIYLKIIQDYADTYNECISPQQEVCAFHKFWTINENLVNSWVSSSNNNILNLLTSLTLIDYRVDYIIVEFKHFKAVKLYPGQTLTFPSNFEYSYRVHLREQSVYILFSQVLINPV